MRYLVVSRKIEGKLTSESIEEAGIIISYSVDLDVNNPRKAYHYAKDAARYHRGSMVVYQNSETEFEAV